MPDRNIWLFTAAALVVVMLFFNRKVRLWAVLKEQIKVFKNAKKQRISLWDCLCFLVFPWVFSYICVYQLDFVIEEELAQLLTTVFSIVFTVLFGFAAVMVGKIDSTHKNRKTSCRGNFCINCFCKLNVFDRSDFVYCPYTNKIRDYCKNIIGRPFGKLSYNYSVAPVNYQKEPFFLYVDNKD